MNQDLLYYPYDHVFIDTDRWITEDDQMITSSDEVIISHDHTIAQHDQVIMGSDPSIGMINRCFAIRDELIVDCVLTNMAIDRWINACDHDVAHREETDKISDQSIN